MAEAAGETGRAGPQIHFPNLFLHFSRNRAKRRNEIVICAPGAGNGGRDFCCVYQSFVGWVPAAGAVTRSFMRISGRTSSASPIRRTRKRFASNSAASRSIRTIAGAGPTGRSGASRKQSAVTDADSAALSSGAFQFLTERGRESPAIAAINPVERNSELVADPDRRLDGDALFSPFPRAIES